MMRRMSYDDRFPRPNRQNSVHISEDSKDKMLVQILLVATSSISTHSVYFNGRRKWKWPMIYNKTEQK